VLTCWLKHWTKELTCSAESVGAAETAASNPRRKKRHVLLRSISRGHQMSTKTCTRVLLYTRPVTHVRLFLHCWVVERRIWSVCGFWRNLFASGRRPQSWSRIPANNSIRAFGVHRAWFLSRETIIMRSHASFEVKLKIRTKQIDGVMKKCQSIKGT